VSIKLGAEESTCGDCGAGDMRCIEVGRCGVRCGEENDASDADLRVFARRCAACSLRFCSFSARSFSFSASRCTFLSSVLNFEMMEKNSSGVVVRGSSPKKVTTSVNAFWAEANS
jgi:hypothetical protein